MKNHYILPNWPAPKNIKAVTTTRQFGHSTYPYNEFNLANHVNDDPASVQANRNLLSEELQLPNQPIWLSQTHSNNVAYIANPTQSLIAADSSITNQRNFVCTVLTADCLPILLCDKRGTIIAAIHAGWRGILNGIIENTVKQMNIYEKDLMAWFGPAIGLNNFFVKKDFYDSFVFKDSNFEKSFKRVHNNQWLADIFDLARQVLYKLGVNNIYGGEICTYTNNDLFFSYRRDGEKTGRMASLIWLT